MLCVIPGESGSDGPLKQKPDEAFHARDAGRSNGRPDRDRGLRDGGEDGRETSSSYTASISSWLASALRLREMFFSRVALLGASPGAAACAR
jgi:hypothetical protein